MRLKDVRLLEDAQILPGERWVYIADFNVKHDGDSIPSPERIDVEIEDLQQIVKSGGIVAILAHKGRFKDKDTEGLDFVVPYLAKKLDTKVFYSHENTGLAATALLAQLRPGEVAVMGNTRTHPGEEANDPELAVRFKELGTKLAVGGFGKAHRAHASNVGLLDHLPGYLTRSQVREMELLEPWAGREEGSYSVAVVGGIKKEKITIGLEGFAKTYDAVIPGGIVLNTILDVQGHDIGGSVLTDAGKSFQKEVRGVLESTDPGKIHVPDQVVVGTSTAEGFRDLMVLDLRHQAVPRGSMILSYIMPEAGRKALEEVVARRGRMIVAGTPDLFSRGLGLATAEVATGLRNPNVRGILLGGDTAAELGFKGPCSTGGGSALYFVAHGTTPVLEALKRNRTRLP